MNHLDALEHRSVNIPREACATFARAATPVASLQGTSIRRGSIW